MPKVKWGHTIFNILSMPHMLVEKDLRLRPLRDSDAAVLASLANNKKIWDNLRDFFPHPYEETDALFFIDLTKKEKPLLNFGIEFQGELCGVIGLTPQPDIYCKSAEIGYWLGEAYWNKGLATRAIKLITDYGFETLQLVRIYTGIFEYNPGSMRALEKNGYEKDGVFKKSVFKNGQIWDEHRYSITR